jgi:phospholipase C
VLRLIESRFGVEIPNLTKWRRETSGDLTAAFGFGQAPDPSFPSLPPTAGSLRVVERQVKTLPAPVMPSIQSMPKPEAAAFIRRRRPSRTA